MEWLGKYRRLISAIQIFMRKGGKLIYELLRSACPKVGAPKKDAAKT